MNPMQRMRLLISRGEAQRFDDTGGHQVLQVDGLPGETKDGVERVQNFGLTSHPPTGATPIMVAVGGSREHLVAVAVDHEQTRPRGLAEGETMLYNAYGVQFLFDKDGNAVLKCKTFRVIADDAMDVQTPQATFSAMATIKGLFSFLSGMSGKNGAGGKTSIEGDIEHSGGKLTSNGVTLDSHAHDGVTKGGDQSGGPVK